MKEAQYELKQSFQYAAKGDTVDASFVTLMAPNYKQMQHMVPIKQAFTAAIKEIAADVAEPETADQTESTLAASEAIALMYQWTGDLTKVILHAEQLFKSGVALVDGETKMTTPLMEKMAVEDIEGLLGCYIANFIAPSLMDGN